MPGRPRAGPAWAPPARTERPKQDREPASAGKVARPTDVSVAIRPATASHPQPVLVRQLRQSSGNASGEQRGHHLAQLRRLSVLCHAGPAVLVQGGVRPDEQHRQRPRARTEGGGEGERIEPGWWIS